MSPAGGRGEVVAWWILVGGLAALALAPLTVAWDQAPDLGHGWAAPMLAGYLCWERWGERPARIQRGALSGGWWVAGVLLVVAAILPRLLLTPYPLWPVALAFYEGLFAALALGLAWLTMGWGGVRWLGGALLVFLGTLPWNSRLEQLLIFPLREGMASLAAELSFLIGRPAVAAGSSIRLASGWVGIDEACGGIRSLQAALMAALFFGEWLRLSWPRRLGLLAVGAAAAVVGNFLRVLFLMWRAGYGPDALHAAHDMAGWCALGVSLLLVWGGARWLRAGTVAPAPVATAARATAPAVSTRSILRLAWTVLVALLAIDAGTRWWYARGAAIESATVPQWTVRFPEGDRTFHPQPLAAEAGEILRPDGYAAGLWNGSDGRQRSAYYIEWKKGQAARSVPFLHNPTVCLPMAGCELVRETGTILVHWEGGEIPFHTYVFRQMNDEFAVAFTVWDPSRAQPLDAVKPGWRGWWEAQWRDVREGHRDQPAQLFTFALYNAPKNASLGEEVARMIVAPAR